jgi:hypothetical protein
MLNSSNEAAVGPPREDNNSWTKNVKRSIPKRQCLAIVVAICAVDIKPKTS